MSLQQSELRLPGTSEEFVGVLLSAPDGEARRILLEEHPEFTQLETVSALKERADHLEQDDARQALAIGLVAAEVAEALSSDEARALAFWIQANAYDYLAENESALRCYDLAAGFFKAAGKPLESAQTGIGQMFTLMQLGQFDRAQSLAEAVRAVFVEQGDLLSQAKIDMNLGNLHYQQGRYARALEDYRRATDAFQSLGETLYSAMNQINQASALTKLDDFLAAEQLHQQARPVFEAAGLRAAAASVDHDLAILKYSRGDYAEAFRVFERARDIFADIDSQVNIAITDLAESDLYLDLNLPDEALRLAEQAKGIFSGAGMTFETARSHGNHALALARLSRQEQAAVLLDEARGLFAAQGNETWTAHTDLQRAEVLEQAGQHHQARDLASEAARLYERLGMKTRQAYAHILLANSLAEDEEWQSALGELLTARKVLKGLAAPWLERRIEVTAGRVQEGLGNSVRAIAHYRKAVSQTERMLTSLTAEEHRTAFVADKLLPYEALVSLSAAGNPSAAFRWTEQAKSRALVDLLAAGVRPRPHTRDGTDARRVERLQSLREELNWLYTRLTRGAESGESGAPAAGPDTWAKIREREREATSLWRALQARHPEELSLMRTTPLPASAVQAGLADDTALVEYFVARGQVTAFVLTRNKVRSYPALVSLADLLPSLEALAFQFSKFHYGPAYYLRHQSLLLDSVREILARLGGQLLAPLWDVLSGVKAVNLVPHGPLHALPFHALRVQDRHFLETHIISYAPSAGVLKFCWDKRARTSDTAPVSGKPLLVGVSDERTSHVQDEIRALAGRMEGAEVLLEGDATFDRFSSLAPACGLIHLAAHGLFRPDAPLLSSIRLADRWLAVEDIYNLELDASLVTLSACETGLGRDAGGDDLVGLVRGFLYAGARSLVVSLWMVDDEATTRLMTGFYNHWLAGSPKAQALRQAQLDLMQEVQHPYFWAPLVLVGDEK